MFSQVYVGIGSNLGNRHAYYFRAVDLMAALPATTITRRSSLYESEPIGDAQRWYLNGVVELATDFEPTALLARLQKIEADLGRKRTPQTKKWAARTIDLDILLFETRIVDEENLKIPHPEMHRRRFVLLPLCELAPQVRHPRLGATIAELLAGLTDDKRVLLLPPTGKAQGRAR